MTVVLPSTARSRPLVGRTDEVDALVAVTRRAVHGQAGALLVSGEAGVGKTALLREVCRRVTGEVDILWASCLPLTSLTVPFLPLTSMLRDWAAARGAPAPALVQPGGGMPGGGVVEFDAWLEEACRQRPVLLVVDDLQWADQSSLDVLMYVLAGLAGRRLAVAATLRTSEVGRGHPLRRWLADVRRLPGVESLHLDRLDRLTTAQQLAGLLGHPPQEILVDELFAVTRGNAYLTTLLARGLSPDATSLPAALPTDVQDAVARAWQRLSPKARRLTQLIAVAGRPQRADSLVAVATAAGPDGALVPLLREAVDGGVVEVGAGGRYWFVHPLLAEVLADGLLPDERQALHAVFAAVLERAADRAEQAGTVWLIDLADHHHRAGHTEEAYRRALLAAEAAERADGGTEMLRLLRRALDLWPRVPDAGMSRTDLLLRIRSAAERAGKHDEELATVEEVLPLIHPERRPLLRADLLVRRTHLRYFTGLDFFALDGVLEAVRLSAAHPGSAEHALAVAELADAELFHGRPSGRRRALEALRLARASGSTKALTYALTATMHAGVVPGGGADRVAAIAEESRGAAARVRDFYAFVHATFVGADSIDGPASSGYLECLRHSRETLTALDAPHTYVAWLCAVEAQGLLLLGDWRTCVERLRVALGASPGPTADVIARLTAAQLACWQGRPAEAHAHLARADELFTNPSTFRVHPFDAVRTELAVASGDTELAVSTAMNGVQGDWPATMIERLLPLAARAITNRVQSLRDQQADATSAVDQLDQLRRLHPTVVADIQPGPTYQAQLRAMQALYDAEVCRARLGSDAGDMWIRAANACRQGRLAWDEAYAQWRAAETLLPSRERRDAGAAALRRAHELAVDLQAAPLLAQIRPLAEGARVPLSITPIRLPADGTIVSGLTRREREILSHVAAGRTYSEIARALTISEKTVSAHISNMLRKTGTANRIELAQLAQRLTGPAANRT